MCQECIPRWNGEQDNNKTNNGQSQGITPYRRLPLSESEDRQEHDTSKNSTDTGKNNPDKNEVEQNLLQKGSEQGKWIGHDTLSFPYYGMGRRVRATVTRVRMAWPLSAIG
jgi:hypothetical protein